MQKTLNLGKSVAFLISLLVWSNLSIANGSDFEKFKVERLTEIDQRIQKLQDHRSCVSSANSFGALHQCGEEMRGWCRTKIDERRTKRDERKKAPSN